LSYYHSKITR